MIKHLKKAYYMWKWRRKTLALAKLASEEIRQEIDKQAIAAILETLNTSEAKDD